MVVFSPADDGQCSGGQSRSGQAPVVNRPESRMAAWSLLAEHCSDAGDDSTEPNEYVKSDSIALQAGARAL
jgi:hypothetical protein